MSWTDSNTVKKHLVDIDRFPTEHKDIPVEFNGTGTGMLPHKGIASSNVNVKRPASFEPVQQGSVTLNGEIWKALTYNQVIPHQIVVAEDSGLQTTYLEGVDYAVDYVNGRLRRIAGGAIGDGNTVQVYYQRYELMTVGVDYTIDFDDGEVAVKLGGALEAETTVWIDYEITAASAVDALIPEAIVQAEDIILSRLKDDYSTVSTDQGLISGATELALAIVCRALASRALSDGAKAAEGRSRAWRNLAEQHEAAAWRTLRPFLNAPTIPGSSRKGNTSWEWA